MSATLATLFTSPADCVKTRMQVNPEQHPTLRKAVARIYSVSPGAGLWANCSHDGLVRECSIVKAEPQDRGIAGFFSGSTLRISRKAASGAIGWTVYEGILLFLRDRA